MTLKPSLEVRNKEQFAPEDKDLLLWRWDQHISAVEAETTAKFQMDTWLETEGFSDQTVYDDPDFCGKVACIAGHAVLLFPEHNQGIFDEGRRCVGTTDGFVSYSQFGAKVLGFKNEIHADCLFLETQLSKEQALEVMTDIRFFIKAKGFVPNEAIINTMVWRAMYDAEGELR